MGIVTFREVAHFYIGQKFQIIKTKQVATFHFYYSDTDEEIGTHDICKADYKTNDVKLILRIMDDMTMKEINHVCKLIYSKENQLPPSILPWKKILIGDFVKSGKAMHYLTKIGIDVFDLIKYEQAIRLKDIEDSTEYQDYINKQNY